MSRQPTWYQALRETPFWAVSALLHLVLLLVILTIPVLLPDEPEARVALVLKQAVKPPPRQPLKNPSIHRKPEVPRLRPRKTPIVQEIVQEIIQEIVEIPRGNPADSARVKLKRFNSTSRLGIGPGGGDLFGERIGTPGRLPPGASEATQAAVRAALEWLRRHQSPDGSWRCRDFTENCERPCENLDPARHGDGRGFPEHDVGVTALAVLAFTAFNHTHVHGEDPAFVACVRRAYRYLKSLQIRSDDSATDGCYGRLDHEQWIYDHALATMAMTELLVMSNDVIGLRRSVERAVRLCLRARNSGSGWRYGVKPGDSDTSVTGWLVLALKTARYTRLSIPAKEFRTSFAGALNWIQAATGSDGRTGYLGAGDPGSRLRGIHEEPYPYSKELSSMTAVGVLCRLFSGQSRRSPAIRKGVDLILRQPPAWDEGEGRSPSRINHYYWYYATHALHQFGGKPWRTWSPLMQRALLSSQRRSPGEEEGSWDPIGEWGAAGGRVYSTALGALTLEVFYRYSRQP